eukprot:2926585-Rhodomonas_salina.1
MEGDRDRWREMERDGDRDRDRERDERDRKTDTDRQNTIADRELAHGTVIHVRVPSRFAMRRAVLRWRMLLPASVAHSPEGSTPYHPTRLLCNVRPHSGQVSLNNTNTGSVSGKLLSFQLNLDRIPTKTANIPFEPSYLSAFAQPGIDLAHVSYSAWYL